MHEPSPGQEVEIDVFEVVLEDLMLGRIDPERDERALVHLGLDLGVALAQLFVWTRATLAEQLRRVVLDLQNVAAAEPVSAGQGIVTRIEFESEEIGGRYETRLERLANALLGQGRCARVLLLGRLGLFALGPSLFALVLHLDPERFRFASVLLADRHAIDAQRALDEP